ncbi:aprataxin and PNK-like factor isoform X2 [Phyllostomus hastatus]|uniref:aprataxin and PNK-like factor isoform X2 n=1 Tax=Phyllostomus hastatus TaxID=9423 RepID=UPI001E683DC3|nr:aprataxin and PNK-like factor isoform X2 [Phyllostomus hastatus]
MSGVFELQPQDGGAPVALAPGETVIGRGPLLGITDKRVSRRHAILEVVGSQLRIKPIHTSPCFYQSSEKSQFLPLKTNLWHWLNPGDSFSLLVDKYIFRVFSTYSETELESTLRNSQMLDADDMLNETPESPLAKLPDKKSGAPQLERSAESFLGECSDFSKQQLNPAQRKRILPAWMLTENLDNAIQESGRGVCKDKTQVNITQQGRKRLISPGSSESMSAEQDTGKKYKNADQEESIISSKQMPQSLSAITLSNTDTNNMKTYAQRNKTPTEELGKVPEHKIIAKGTLRKEEAVSRSESCSSAQGPSCHSESQGSHPECSSGPADPEILHAKATDSVLQGSEENKVKRTSCMYGANCYRKNPVHFQHFSHPGDSDYGRVEATHQDEADNRPECPYGESCYRKNPQHKIEYKHSTLPGRSIVEEDDGQSSEQDLNDSFIDDEEEEYEPTDEDSDWEPGKDEEKEDVEELLKEAKTFMKRKK